MMKLSSRLTHKVLSVLKKKQTAGVYIFSGLFKTFVQAFCGFVVLRWLKPEDLGLWQSFTVFVGYIQILTLGTTSGLARELPFRMGKGEEEKGIDFLKTTGYFTTTLSLVLMFTVVMCSLALYFTGRLSLDNALMFCLAFSTGALTIQTNFLGATYRSSRSFNTLSKIQFYNTFLCIALLPFVYFFKIWGYVTYQVLLSFFLYWGFYQFRPYKVKYRFNKILTKELIQVGFPIYFWTYILNMTRSIPRLILVLFGNSLLVGLYSPAGSINAAMLNLPNYINKYLYPRMSFMFGKTASEEMVIEYVLKVAKILFLVMLLCVLIIVFSIPHLFVLYFPKYEAGSLAAQISVFAGLFYCISQMFANTLFVIKKTKFFKYLILFKCFLILFFCFILSFFVENLLIVISIGSVCTEFINCFVFYIVLKKSVVHGRNY